MSNPGHGTRRITHKVWRGVIIMFEQPHAVAALRQDQGPHTDLNDTPTIRLKQKDADCVIRAIDWARAMERRF